MIQMNLLLKQKQTHILRKLTYGYQGGREGVRDRWGLGLTCTNFYIYNR